MATKLRIFLEKHNGRTTGGSYFRTRKGVLIGRGVAAKTFRGEECEVSAELWEKAEFRRDVYNSLRLPGYQVVPRFEMVEVSDAPSPVNTPPPIEAHQSVAVPPPVNIPKRPMKRRPQFIGD